MPPIYLLAIIIVFISGGILFYIYIKNRAKTANIIDTSYLEALWEVEKLILGTLNFDEVAEKVTNTILTQLGYLKLGYQIVVLALVDEKKGILRRVAISRTSGAQKFLSTSPVPFSKIEISLQENSNIAIQALKENKIKFTNEVTDILYPVVDPNFVKKLQKELNIKTSMVIPISVNQAAFGVLIFSATKEESEISSREKIIIQSFTQAVGISIQNASLFTSLKDTTKQLQEVNEKLKELDQLKDDFVSVASHELRTPMTAIRSYVWMALHRSDIHLSQKLEKYLYRTLVSTERLINLVNDLLNVSRIESGRIEINPKSFSIVELVRDVVEEVKAKANEKRLLINVMEHALPFVFADADKVHQILLNLIGNALKFTYPGGQIIIDFFTDGQMVETSVKDTGTGITKEDLGKLFHKFSRLENSYTAISTSGGTGLGLFISKNLIEVMRGKIWASSEGAEQGSTFTFSLPAATRGAIEHADEYAVKSRGEAKPLEPVAI